MPMKISVFGGSSPEEGSPAYEQAYHLGKLLGSHGMVVMTGGYMGTMEAVSRGASESGSHVIGVTSEAIEAYRPTSPNQWVDEEWRFKGFKERLNALVEECDAAIALPGGIGTLLEICLTWNQMLINSIQPKPLILVGEPWQNVIQTFFDQLDHYISGRNRKYISFAPDTQSAVDLLMENLKYKSKNQ